jgi:hypothetical protein
MIYEDEAILYKYCCQDIDLDGHRSLKNGGKAAGLSQTSFYIHPSVILRHKHLC